MSKNNNYFKKKWKKNNEYQNRENISKLQEDIQPERKKLKRKIFHKTYIANKDISINNTINKKDNGYVFCTSCSFEAKCICSTKELKKEKIRKCVCGGTLTFTFNQQINC